MVQNQKFAAAIDTGLTAAAVTARRGPLVKINACSIFTVVDGKFTDQRIYVDNGPVDRFLS